MMTFKEKAAQFNTYKPKMVRHIQIPNAKALLEEALTAILNDQGRDLIWLPEYDLIVEWLTDNHKKGLLLMGQVGLGKSILIQNALPTILIAHRISSPVIHAADFAHDDMLIYKPSEGNVVFLDEMGVESEYTAQGRRQNPIQHIVDLAERRGALMAIATNLNSKMMKARYGDRIYDRLKAYTTRVILRGNSLR